MSAALSLASRPIEADIALCRAVTRAHAKTFSFAAFLLPREERWACYAVYAFCRRADDAVDAAPSPEAAALALRSARARLDAASPDSPDGELRALAWAMRRFSIPRSPLDELLDGMALDLRPFRARTTQETLHYCALAAGTVGRALAHIFGAPASALVEAEALGIAMQLTNILRDVDEDLALGRAYLPELREVRERRLTPALRAALQGYVRRARELYAHAERGIARLPSLRARLCVRAMGVMYGDILRALEAQGLDPFAGRARVPLRRKLLLLAGCLLGRRLPHPEAA